MAAKITKDKRKEIINRAIVDPGFRKKLFSKPEEVFGCKLTADDKASIERIKRMIPAVDALVNGLAGEILCGGGGCGGLA